MGEMAPPARRISSLFLLVIIVTLAFSITALYLAIESYKSQGVGEGYNFYNLLLMGAFGLALSTYLLYQTRRRVLRLTLEVQRIVTTILCQRCGFKNIREFQRGDYIFKDADACPKCNEKMIIASIYREAKERGKGED